MTLRIRPRKNNQGFNLIESLVVMMVIILLASIVIPGLMGKRSKQLKLPERTIKKPVPTKIEMPVPPVTEETSATEANVPEAEASTLPVTDPE